MPHPVFNFPLLAAETVNTLVRPRAYFAAMPKEGGFGYPLFKVVVYALASAVISSAIIYLSPLPKMGAAGILMPLAVFPLMSVIGIFISSAVLLLFSFISRGDVKFESSLRSSASIGAMMVVQVALLSAALFIPRWIVSIVSLAAAGYVLYLTYCALTVALKGKPSRAKIIVLCLAGIYILAIVSSWFTGRALRKAAINSGIRVPVAGINVPVNAPPPVSDEIMSGALEREINQATQDMTPEQKAIMEQYMKAVQENDTVKMEALVNKMLATESNSGN